MTVFTRHSRAPDSSRFEVRYRSSCTAGIPSCHASQDASEDLPPPSTPSIAIRSGNRFGVNAPSTRSSSSSDPGKGFFIGVPFPAIDGSVVAHFSQRPPGCWHTRAAAHLCSDPARKTQRKPRRSGASRPQSSAPLMGYASASILGRAAERCLYRIDHRVQPRVSNLILEAGDGRYIRRMAVAIDASKIAVCSVPRLRPCPASPAASASLSER